MKRLSVIIVGVLGTAFVLGSCSTEQAAPKTITKTVTKAPEACGSPLSAAFEDYQLAVRNMQTVNGVAWTAASTGNFDASSVYANTEAISDVASAESDAAAAITACTAGETG